MAKTKEPDEKSSTSSITLYTPDGTPFEAPVYTFVSPYLHSKIANIESDLRQPVVAAMKKNSVLTEAMLLPDEAARKEFVREHTAEIIEATDATELAEANVNFERNMRIIQTIIDRSKLTEDQKALVEQPHDADFWTMHQDYDAIVRCVEAFRQSRTR